MHIDCPFRSLRLVTALGLTLLFSPWAQAESYGDLSVDELKRQVLELSARINQLKRTIAAEEAALRSIQGALGLTELDAARAKGTAGTGAEPAEGSAKLAQRGGNALKTTEAVGKPPVEEKYTPPVAALFDQPGVLTPRGKYVLEPSLQYTYASSSRVALVGYTIIPALVVGLIDVREVKRNTVTAALTGRWGITNRFEIEAKAPMVYRTDDTLERPLASGSAVDTLFSSNGRGVGDVEVTGRYQLNEGGMDKPYYVGTLRFKSRTGKDPFEVTTANAVPGGGLNTQLQRQLPTGSGFYTIQPGLTALIASDPAVFFGSVSYQYNIPRSNISLQTDTGPQYVGKVKPGGVLGLNLGMGLALNDRASFSLGYDHAVVGKTKINGVVTPNSMTAQLGTLLLGFSYRLDDRSSMNLSLGVGATRDAPDIQLTLRIPYSF